MCIRSQLYACSQEPVKASHRRLLCPKPKWYGEKHRRSASPDPLEMPSYTYPIMLRIMAGMPSWTKRVISRACAWITRTISGSLEVSVTATPSFNRLSLR